ncbi:MAG: hypothetical protein EOR60_26120 [Mesorhizobium sp.]|nr:MAG: hypothetical protein EOR60_26120 [Mesorhizobium sp.]
MTAMMVKAHMQFYHVSMHSLLPGNTISPGSWARNFIGFKPDTRVGMPADFSSLTTFMWDMSLETARMAVNPKLPSRLKSLFLWESKEDAIWFKENYRKQGAIYLVEPAGELAEFHRGSFSAITPGGRSGDPYIKFIPPVAAKYWTDEPSGRVEVLYPGQVSVVEKLSATSTI